MKKILIAYFSRPGNNYVDGNVLDLPIGNTKQVVDKITQRMEADVFLIAPKHAYANDYETCTKEAQSEFQFQVRPALAKTISSIDSYDTIILGYPNWWGTMPMCVWTFLEQFDFTNKTIYPFCTHEGSGLGTSVKDIKKLCPNSQIQSGLAIRGSQVSNCDTQLEKWLDSIKKNIQ